MDPLLWYLLAGTRGGLNRLRLVRLLRANPLNAHQVSELLSIDYRTARHHLRILERNGLVVRLSNAPYGTPYFLSGRLEAAWETVEEIAGRLDRPTSGAVRPAAHPRRRAAADHRPTA
jgi:DNA-binding transcriptional ArsR family regulator